MEKASIVNKGETRQKTKSNQSVDNVNGSIVESGNQSPQLYRENGLVKLLRIIIYFVSVGGVVVGASLIKSGNMSTSYADGTHDTKIQNGQIIFFVFLLVLYANIMWGILRWFLRGYREKWRPGRTMGKLIGGGIWRTLVFVPLVLISALFIAPRIIDISFHVSTKQGTPELPLDRFSRLQYLEDNLESLSAEEIKDEISDLLLNYIDFGTDASSNISSNRSNNEFLSNTAHARSTSVVTLNKAKLSNEGHFVVFYTDTGDSRISDEQAEVVASILETAVTGFKNSFGLDFEYQPTENNGSRNPVNKYISKEVTNRGLQEVLESHGIDNNIIETAMPVYVVSPFREENNVCASYAGITWEQTASSAIARIFVHIQEKTGIFGDKPMSQEDAKAMFDMMQLYSSTPSFPFMHVEPGKISSDASSYPIIMAHELGHHYSAMYNLDNYGEIGSGDGFIKETSANWMAINVLPDQPTDNDINSYWYNDIYLSSTDHTINETAISETTGEETGYAAHAFLENYYQIVPNAFEKIMKAQYLGDALRNLYELAGAEDFKKVMISLAEKNLTGDYGGKLVNLTTPRGSVIGCAGICTVERGVQPAAIDYLYFSASDFIDDTIEIADESNVIAGSLIGRKADGSWEVIESGKTEIEFDIDKPIAEEYAVLVLAVVNSSISNEGSYRVKVTKTEIREIITDEGSFDFSQYNFPDQSSGPESPSEPGGILPSNAPLEAGFSTDSKGLIGSGPGCYEIDTNELFDGLIGIVDAGTELVDTLAKLGETIDPSADLSDAREGYNEQAEEAKKSLTESKAELAQYVITICGSYIAEGNSFDSVKSKLQSALSGTMNLLDERDGNNRYSAFVGADLLARTGRVYLLIQSGDSMGLITVNATERYSRL